MTDVYKAPEALLHEPKNDGEYGSVESALAGEYELRPIEIVKQAWEKLPGMKGPFWAAAAIYMVMAILFSALQFAVGGGSANQNFSLLGDLIIPVIQTAVMAPIVAGLAIIAIKHSVGAPVQFNEIFAHYGKIFPLFICLILYYVLSIIGFILLVIPGIYLVVAYSMAIPLVVDKNMGPWEALETSRKAVTKKWFNMGGYWLVSLVVVLAGALALLVGLIWAYPLVVLAYGMIYRDMFGVSPETLAGD